MNERSWGAVQIRESDSFWLEFTAIPSPATPPAAGEPRSVEEALGMWLVKHHGSAVISRYERVETDGVLTQLRVYLGGVNQSISHTSMQYGSREVMRSTRVDSHTSSGGAETPRPGTMTTYTYDGTTGCLVGVAENADQVPDRPADDPARTARWLARLDRFTIEMTDSFGRKVSRALLANHVDPSHTPAQRYDEHYRKFRLMENAIDQIPGLFGDWALMSAMDRHRNHTDYVWDDAFGVVRVTPLADGEPVEFAVPPGHRLVRQTDPDTGEIRHRVEPIQKKHPLSEREA